MAGPYAYDVFVSYRHAEPDGPWVRGQLVPRLRAGGLAVCLDVDDFRLGAPLILEMERAVEASRYTLAVLSPRYLASGFTELESVLAGHLGPDRAGLRLAAVMYEQTRPARGLPARRCFDMTDPAGFETAAARVCAELRRPQEGRPEAR